MRGRAAGRPAWRGQVTSEDGVPFRITPHAALPVAAPDLVNRSWLAVNSLGAAQIAGRLGFNMLFSHLRAPAEYSDYARAYREHAIHMGTVHALERQAIAGRGERYVIGVGSAGGEALVVDCRHRHSPAGPRLLAE